MPCLPETSCWQRSMLWGCRNVVLFARTWLHSWRSQQHCRRHKNTGSTAGGGVTLIGKVTCPCHAMPSGTGCVQQRCWLLRVVGLCVHCLPITPTALKKKKNYIQDSRPTALMHNCGETHCLESKLDVGCIVFFGVQGVVWWEIVH